MAAKTSAHYISGTHWDREWYRPFQEYRVLLVQLMDGLLDLMETNGDFKYFQLDGQTCVLDDYLEIRPENRVRLARLISEGRILIGPWFTMPDLFCPDDESLIRNLLLGQRISREWGVEPMPVGFTCDMFGHPSQMPQLFAGFGYDDVVLGRGTNEFDTDMYFHWESPDGSQVLVYKLQDKQGYGAFALPRAILEGADGVAADQLPDRDAFRAEVALAAGDPAALRKVREKYGQAELARYVNSEAKRANVPVVAVMDSMDHVAPAGDVALYLRLIREVCTDVQAVHSTLPAFFADVRKRTKGKKLESRQGELRAPSRNKCEYLYLIPNCVSARVGLKLTGDAATALLERWAEPLVALNTSAGETMGGTSLLPYLRVAWTQVLLNHAHDSVCGCSIDQVNRDMLYRYEQADVIGRQLRHQAFASLSAGCRELSREKHAFTLVLCNPLPFARDEVISFDVDLPMDFPTEFHEGFRTQSLKAFTLETAEGEPLPCQYLSSTSQVGERSRVAKFCFISEGPFTRIRVAARVALPACGFTSLLVRPSTKPVRLAGSLRTGPVEARNEHLAIALQPNGTLTLTDRATGQSYTDLLTFEDRSEVGDGWFHGHSLNDRQILSTAGTAQITVLHDGPNRVTFGVTVKMAVPLRYDWHTQAPSLEETCLTVTSEITLCAGARVVEVTTHVVNRAEDHRLQLLLPTDAKEARTFFAHTPYDLTERQILLDPKTVDWQEMEITEKPFQNLQSVGCGHRGLAFLSAGGLHEGGVRDDLRRTLQVTLLRSFRRTVGTEGEADGLELGTRTYRYGLMPYSGSLPAVTALREVARLQAGVITRQSGTRSSGYPALPAEGVSTLSVLEQLDESLVFSAIKPAEEGDALILRLWNPAAEKVTGRVRFFRPLLRAQLCALNEKIQGEADVDCTTGVVTVAAGPWQIVTLRIEFSR